MSLGCASKPAPDPNRVCKQGVTVHEGKTVRWMFCYTEKK